MFSDIRKSLLEKILSKGKGENTINPETFKADKETDLENDAIVESNSIIEDDDFQTTLHASTTHPNHLPSTEYLEVATIRSPYSFDYENEKSTRY